MIYWSKTDHPHGAGYICLRMLCISSNSVAVKRYNMYNYLHHLQLEGVVVQWCNPLTLKPEQSGGVGSIRDRASPLERHDKGSRTRLALSYFCDPSAWR